MSAMVDLSVCVVNWNCREVLRRCLASLRAVRGVNLEVIVVDNGSTDGAAEMVAREFPEVALIRNSDNAGFARANNQAAQNARGRHLLFLNNDTEVPPDAPARLLEYLESRPEVGLVAPKLRGSDGRPQGSCRGIPTVAALLHRTLLLRWTGLFRKAYRRFRGRGLRALGPTPVPVVMGAAMLVRREAFESAGRWDEDFVFGGEDVDLCTRLGRTHAVVYHPDIEIIHLGRAGSRQRPGFVHTQLLLGTIRYLRKHTRSRAALLVYKLVLTADAPLQCLFFAGQYLWRRLRGQTRGAARAWLALQGAWDFLCRGLTALWRL